LEEILDLARKELNKKNIDQGRELVDNIVSKDPTQTSKEEWIRLGKLTGWFLGILALKMSLDVIKKRFYQK
jgi:hypothetical protein